MKQLFLTTILILSISFSIKAQTWSSIPLPPGVTQIGSGGSAIEGVGGNYLYASTLYKENLYKFDGSNWNLIPQIQESYNYIGAGGNNLYSLSYDGNTIYRYNGTSWVALPASGISGLNPETGFIGATENILYITDGTIFLKFNGISWDQPLPLPVDFGSNGGRFLKGGGNYVYAITQFGEHLYRFNGTAWSEILLPPGENQVDYLGFLGAGGNYAYYTGNDCSKLYRFDGTSWISIPLQPELTCEGTDDFLGAVDNYAYGTTNYGANLYKLTNTTAGIHENENENKISVYPNPSTDQININTDINLINSSYTLSNQLGEIVLKGKINSSNTTVDIKNLSNGLYILSIDNYLQKEIKIIKQ